MRIKEQETRLTLHEHEDDDDDDDEVFKVYKCMEKKGAKVKIAEHI